MGWIELGRVGAPFGVKGWVHVESHTDPPEGLLEYADWVLRSGPDKRAPRQVAEAELHGERLVVRFDGIEDRDAAALLTGSVIEVDRAELPPTGDREYYRADLVGLKVRNLDGVELGTVAYFIDAPAGAVMVVKEGGQSGGDQSGPDKSRRDHWVLAVPRHLRKVDLETGWILVDWPAELE